EDAFVADVLVDDALYFMVPARHLWEGHGFSFDKSEVTNGVQALWALVAVAVTGLFEAPLTQLRVMVALSGVFWAGAAGLLYALLRRWSAVAAWTAMTGFTFAGVTGRVAFQGMENGLHAFLSAAVLVVGV